MAGRLIIDHFTAIAAGSISDLAVAAVYKSATYTDGGTVFVCATIRSSAVFLTCAFIIDRHASACSRTCIAIGFAVAATNRIVLLGTSLGFGLAGA